MRNNTRRTRSSKITLSRVNRGRQRSRRRQRCTSRMSHKIRRYNRRMLIIRRFSRIFRSSRFTQARRHKVNRNGPRDIRYHRSSRGGRGRRYKRGGRMENGSNTRLTVLLLTIAHVRQFEPIKNHTNLQPIDNRYHITRYTDFSFTGSASLSETSLTIYLPYVTETVYY